MEKIHVGEANLPNNRMKFIWTVTVLALIATVVASDATTSAKVATSGETKDWWETATFYQIYPRSFKDSNGDGIGDLNGIREKLPYLKSLGITATWLSPIFLSPMKDFGYDIQDFFSIQPEYGTMADFDALVAEANRLGIKIILDFVPNHSSDLNEWFIKSANMEDGFEDYYVWHPGYEDPDNSGQRLPPNNWLSVFRGSGWEWNEQRQEFYYHAFAVQQPDLNYRSARVVQMMKSVLRFWLDRGVGGFRVDTVPHLFEVLPDADGRYPDEPLSGGTTDSLDYGYLNHVYTQAQNSTFDMVYQWRELLDQYQRDHGGDTRVLLTEAYLDIDQEMRFYDNGEGRQGSHIPMNFNMITSLNGASNAAAYKNIFDLWMDNMPKEHTANWVLGNHDQRRVASRYGVERIDMMNMIGKCLPGVSITYNGEEIGMKDVWISWEQTVDPQACNTNKDVYEPFSRDPARTPFQWDNTTGAGFSTNANTWLPISPDYQEVNVMMQEQAKASHLKVFRELVEMRKEPAFQFGTLESYSMMDDQVLVLVRHFNNESDTFILVANVGKTAYQVDLSGKLTRLDTAVVYEVVDSSATVTKGNSVDPKAVNVLPNEAFVLRQSNSAMGPLVSNLIYLSLAVVLILKSLVQ